MNKRSTCSRIALRDNAIAYVMRGSEYGMCFHRHVASLRGMSEASIDAKTRLMFDAGNQGEGIAKILLQNLAVKDSSLKVVEFATGWQNQASVQIEERRHFDDGQDREVRLICSPDGRLSFPQTFFFPDEWVAGLSISLPAGPEQYALEVKCYGAASMKKFKSKGAAAFPTLEWQTSGVAAGYEQRLGEPVGVVVMCLLRDDIKDADNVTIGYSVESAQIPQVWVYDAPKYTRQECLDRCWAIAKAYEDGEWPKCDNAYFCRYPHRATPVVDSIAEAMLESLADAHEAYKNALRDAEGLLIGHQNGATIHGFQICREYQCLPNVRRL